jgi:hypothetical protein
MKSEIQLFQSAVESRADSTSKRSALLASHRKRLISLISPAVTSLPIIVRFDPVRFFSCLPRFSLHPYPPLTPQEQFKTAGYPILFPDDF